MSCSEGARHRSGATANGLMICSFISHELEWGFAQGWSINGECRSQEMIMVLLQGKLRHACPLV